MHIADYHTSNETKSTCTTNQTFLAGDVAFGDSSHKALILILFLTNKTRIVSDDPVVNMQQRTRTQIMQACAGQRHVIGSNDATSARFGNENAPSTTSAQPVGSSSAMELHKKRRL
jgi:hypothetical protein